MSGVMSKTNLFPSWPQNHHRHSISSCYLKSCPSKLNARVLKSTSSSSISSSNLLERQKGFSRTPILKPRASIVAQAGVGIGKTQKWWERGLQPNMKEVSSAQDLVDSLLNAGNKLVVVDFFSPGCGGCKALHPKICQFAELNPDVEYLQVNYEEHKSMCYSLNVHVLPFFRFYRGSHGRLCSFSCTNATIKKFKGALAKHTTARCSLGPAKGFEEKDLLALAANKQLSFNYTPKPIEPASVPAELVTDSGLDTLPLPSTMVSSPRDAKEKKALVTTV